ncbi:Baculoviral IAP repeat-containing protein 7-A [Mizuhopecten yessoensis]|uniref:Baculoviral IAP repeat-containing protein 7-A n=2 Tax=Mizuhopecten yessoensis TaxID=6573 RepID=A0A210R602_MIZYE|nr:Baculoviral IAP repeat-containing protein 7-A [Mizuhopecten yessoensis]
MESELSRLASFFSFPFNSPVSPTDLAKAGFYYEGNRDEVICCKCSFKYRCWQKGDVPFLVHSTKSPNCPLVRSDNRDTSATGKVHDSLSTLFESVSISSNSGAAGGHEDSQNNVPRNLQQATFEATLPASPDIAPNRAPDIPLPASPDITPNRAPDIPLPIVSTDQPNVEGGSPTAVTNNSMRNRSVPDERSAISRVRNEQSQQAGTITSTTPQNIKESLDEDRSMSITTSHDIPGNEREDKLMMEPLGVTETQPKYQQFAILATRLTTYKSWPSNLNQRPEQLAKCGLFYEGSHDYVRCFHCAGGLREWEPQDDPWIEHARWFPFCTFMRQLKGDRFIMDVQSGKITSQLQGASAMTSKQGNVSASAMASKQEDVPGVSMDHPAFLSVMDMGYTQEMVTKAISSLRKQKDKTLTAENLLQVVWDIEESGETLEEEDKEINDDTVNTSTQPIPHNSNSDTTKPEPVHQQPTTTDLESLVNENRELREQKACKVCLDEEASIVFLPCGHLVTCPMCSSALRKCPVCRSYIRGTVKAIIS